MRTTLQRARSALPGCIVLAVGLGLAATPGRTGAQQAAAGLRRGTLLVNGLERAFAVYVPGSVSPGAPVVLALHGGSGGSGDRLRGLIGPELERLAEAAGFLVAYPDGIGGNWNDCRAGASYSANLEDIDEPAFLRALILRLDEEFGADPRLSYAIGYSNGGHLAYRMALESPGLLQGIAVFAANLPAAGGLDCREAATPLPVMIVNGTADVINPFEGGEVVLPDGTRLGRVRSARQTLAYFGALAGFHGEPPRRVLLDRDSASDLRVVLAGWREAGRPGIVLYTVQGGGHTIPSPRATFPDYVGRVERRLSGVSEAIRFFGLQ